MLNDLDASLATKAADSINGEGGQCIPVAGDSSDPALIRQLVETSVAHFGRLDIVVANAGNALAVISRQGIAQLVSRKHDPFDRNEIQRIRAAEGWVSPKGFVNDEIDVSRSFGFYYILPLTAPKVVSTPSTDIPAATIKPSTDQCTLTIGDYNVRTRVPFLYPAPSDSHTG